MKIYNKIVMNIATGEIIEEDSYEYDGPIAECKGGSTSTTSVDPVYNARMAAIAETNQGYADEMYNMFKYGVPYDPYSNSDQKYKTGKQINNPAHDEWQKKMDEYRRNQSQYDYSPEGGSSWRSIPHPGPEPPKTIPEVATRTNAEVFGYDFNNPPVSEMQLMSRQIQAQASLLPEQTEAERSGLELKTATNRANLGLVDLTADVTRSTLEAQKQVIGQKSNLYTSLYDQAMEGQDVDKQVAEARSGVMQDFSKAGDITARNLSRMGLDPSSGAGRGALVNTGIEQAKALAGASQAARQTAEDTNFQRKVTALGIGG